MARFASHLIGFAQKTTDEDGDSTTVGKMGVEASFNDVLKGKNGSLLIRVMCGDTSCRIQTNMLLRLKDGDDLYLTIDKKDSNLP